MRCTKPRQPALNENFNLPYGSHVKKHDTRLLIGRIAFLTCGKNDTRHLIGLHRFANENLLCGFSVCKSQYVYNKIEYATVTQWYIFWGLTLVNFCITMLNFCITMLSDALSARLSLW